MRQSGQKTDRLLHVRTRARARRGDQCLRDDFGVRIARVPRLDDMDAKQGGRGCARNGADQTLAAKLDPVRTARIAHHAMTRRAPVTPSNPYAMAIQTGYPCGNWPVTVPAFGSRR